MSNGTNSTKSKTAEKSKVEVKKKTAVKKTYAKLKKVYTKKATSNKSEHKKSVSLKPGHIKLSKKHSKKVEDPEEEGPEPTEQQIAAFKRAIDLEKSSGTVLDELDKDEDKEKEENDKAAQDAMKDLDVCYGDEESQKEQ
jgi:hypothetical protein